MILINEVVETIICQFVLDYHFSIEKFGIKELIKNTIYKIESKSDFNIIELESVFSVGEASPETIIREFLEKEYNRHNK